MAVAPEEWVTVMSPATSMTTSSPDAGQSVRVPVVSVAPVEGIGAAVPVDSRQQAPGLQGLELQAATKTRTVGAHGANTGATAGEEIEHGHRRPFKLSFRNERIADPPR